MHQKKEILAPDIEDLEIRLEEIRSVVIEIARYFVCNIKPNTYEAEYLIHKIPHIDKLLGVVDDLLVKSIHDHQAIIDKQYNTDKEGGL